MVDDRHFVFSCGVGLDATVVKRVDAHPKLKARAGPYYYTWAGVSAFYRQLPAQPGPAAGRGRRREPVEGITALAQNSDPFTYFASRPIRVCEGIAIDDGTLSLGVLKRATQRDMPTLIAAPLQRARSPPPRHRQIEHFDDVTEATVDLDLDGQGRRRPAVPGPGRRRLHRRRDRVELGVDPGALTIVA